MTLPRILRVAAAWGYGLVAGVYLMLSLDAMDAGMGIWIVWFGSVVVAASFGLWWLIAELARQR